MIAVLAVLFGSLAALAGALATVGWQRAARAAERERWQRRRREALAEIVDPPPLPRAGAFSRR